MIRTLSVLLLALGLFTGRARAQEVRLVEGEKYIVHTVVAGQTLFGISKHYAAELDAVTKANPGAAAGLSIGQTLLIPMADRSRKEIRTAPKLQQGELLHTAAKRETVYGIAKRYGITQEALARANPELANGLRQGMQLRIPIETSTDAPPGAVTPAYPDSAAFHLVLPGETLYSLAKQFGTTPEGIKAANNQLPEGLKAGLYIRIPKVQAVQADTLATPVPFVVPPRNTLRKVAVLLPFTATARDSAGSTSGADRSQVVEAAVEFRAGMAIALDTLEALGLNAEVRVFDTGTRPSQWDALFRNDELRGMDLYLGPFHRAALESIVRISGKAPVVCPVQQSNKVLLGNPTVSKAVSSRTDQVKELARFAVRHRDSANLIMLRPAIPAERDLQDLMLRELNAAASAAMPVQDSAMAVDCGRRDVARLLPKLDPARMNVVVVPSEDVEFVTAAVTALSGATGKYKLTVYGMDNWRDIPTMDIPALMRLDTRLPASGTIDLEDPRTLAFIGTYRDRFRNEPGQYAFLGYDVTLFYLSGLMQFGAALPMHLNEVVANPLHMAFRFAEYGPENGLCNTSAVMLRYTPEGIRPMR